jgi:translation elongation factor EF-G
VESGQGKRERIGRLVQMRADKRDEIDEVLAGTSPRRWG